MAAADSMGISSPLLGSPFRQKYPPLYGQDIDIDRILERVVGGGVYDTLVTQSAVK